MKVSVFDDTEMLKSTLNFGARDAWKENESLSEEGAGAGPSNTTQSAGPHKTIHSLSPANDFQENLNSQKDADMAELRSNHDNRNITEMSHERNMIRLEDSYFVTGKSRTVLSLFIRNRTLHKRISAFYDLKSVRISVVLPWIPLTILSICATFKLYCIPSYLLLLFQIIYSSHFMLFQLTYVHADVAKEITGSFNFWYTVGLSLSNIMSIILLFGQHIEIICLVIHFFTCSAAIIFLDANYRKNDIEIKMLCFMGIIWATTYVITLALRLTDFETEVVYFGDSDVEILDARQQSLDSVSSISFYIGRILLNYVIKDRRKIVALLSNAYNLVDRQLKPNSGHSTIAKGDMNHPSMKYQCSENKTYSAAAIQGSFPNQTHLKERSLPEPSIRKEYVMVGIFDAKEVVFDSHQTIFHLFIKDKSPFFEKLLQSKTYNAFGLCVCVASWCLSVFYCTGFDASVGAHYLSLFVVSLGVLLTITHILTTCNIFLIKKACRSFDYWYLVYLILKAFISAGILCDWDYRCIYWGFISLVIFWSIMVDTFHTKYRRLSLLTCPIGIASFVNVILCKLNIGRTFSEDRFIDVGGIRLVSGKNMLAVSFLNMCLFLFRFCWTYRQNNNRMFFITEHVKVDELPNDS